MSVTEDMYNAKPPERYECPLCHFLIQVRERDNHEAEHARYDWQVVPAGAPEVEHPSRRRRRDIALMTAIQIGKFVHLTFASGVVEQGWLHLHDGVLQCCAVEGRGECDNHRERVSRLRGGAPLDYPPLDVEHLIRVDVAVLGGGEYTALWHHPDYHDQHHTVSREDLACCTPGAPR